MNVLIIGCGRVGSRLAMTMERQGHTVSVVDRDIRSFRLLDSDFEGFTTAGVPIDDEVLRSAGIESCDALAAVTQDDNTNIMDGADGPEGCIMCPGWWRVLWIPGGKPYFPSFLFPPSVPLISQWTLSPRRFKGTDMQNISRCTLPAPL